MDDLGEYNNTSLLASKNPIIKQNLKLRSRTLAAIRQAFHEREYVEIDTPVLRLWEDATDNPLFSTVAFSGWPRLHLRTCPEEYTRRAAACLGKAFEIGKSFRNEKIVEDSSPRQHLAEFTHVEFYELGNDLDGVIKLLWKILGDVARTLDLPTVSFNGSEIDFFGEYKCFTIYEVLSDSSHPDCAKFIADHWGGSPPGDRQQESKRLEDLLDKYVRPKLLQPTFLSCFPSTADEYPDPTIDNCVQRAEFTIAGIEIGEVAVLQTDVAKLKKHISDALENRHGDASSSTLLDKAYLHEIEVLSSSVIGGGFGLDRLMMILADDSDIRNVVWYPGLSEYFVRRRPS